MNAHFGCAYLVISTVPDLYPYSGWCNLWEKSLIGCHLGLIAVHFALIYV